MPVPTAITDLSTSEASNWPAGTEAPSTIDNTLRAHAAFIAQLWALVGSASGSLSSTSFSTGNLAWTGTLTGGTGVVNIGSGQFYKDASGNVFLNGTTSYRAGKLVVRAANVTKASTTANVHITTTDNQAADLGGSLGLGGFVDAGTTAAPFVYLSGRKENGTSGNYAGYLSVVISDGAGGANEAARIGSIGDVFLMNATSTPGTPSGGGVLYVESGALKYKGSSGTVTTLGAA